MHPNLVMFILIISVAASLALAHTTSVYTESKTTQVAMERGYCQDKNKNWIKCK